MVFQYEMFHMTVMSLRYSRKYLKQCCGAGAGGAEIILRPGAEAEFIFIISVSAVSLEDARIKKR